MLAAVAVEVASESGDPMGETLVQAAQGARPATIERLMHLCESESRRQAVSLRGLALYVKERYLQFLEGEQDDSTGPFQTELARATNNLALRLLELERRDQALAAARRAVTIGREHARDDSGLRQLAASLTNLGVILWEIGKPDEALRVVEEAENIHQQLWARGDAGVARQRASNLMNQGLVLSQMGRREQAAEACREAVELRRHLAREGHPVRAELAAGLDNLGTLLHELGRSKEALQ
jgi:tetratricopeptide (TPR) repeat protein